MKNKNYLFPTLFLILILGVGFGWFIHSEKASLDGQESLAAVAASVFSPFVYSFNTAGTLYEAGDMSESSSPYWWVNSGAALIINDGIGATVQGPLPAGNKFQLLYMKNNPVDTDGGLHPQNIFRLITRSTWSDIREQAYFKIMADNLSSSSNRNQSNGLLLFSRYVDSQNLYYAGIRVDGTAVIKKKQNGIYTTLAQAPVFLGKYNADSSPNLLPKNVWLGLRMETKATATCPADIKVSTDVGQTGIWKTVLEACDAGRNTGPAITGKSYAGIRTDFMDVEFDNYSITNI